MIRTQIIGHTNKKVVTVDDSDGNEPNSLLVATRPYKRFENQIKYFTNPIYGSELNINASRTGAEENVFNGNDDIYWTFSIAQGNPSDFEISTDQNHTPGGTQSLDATGSENDDVAQFARPGGLLSLTDFFELVGWVYYSTAVTNISTKAIEIYGWDTIDGIQVGGTVNLYNYTNPNIVGEWQQFNISLADMTLLGKDIDSIRVRTVDTGGGEAPNYYLDDIDLESDVGIGTQQYTVSPDDGSWFHLQRLKISLYGTYDTTQTDGTVPNLDVDTFLGIDATAGLTIQVVNDREVFASFRIRHVRDLLLLPGCSLDTLVTDSSLNTFLQLLCVFNEPMILKSKDRDYMRISISDNFSSLINFSASVGGKREYVPY